MRIYNKIVYDKDMNVIEEDSYEHKGPITKLKGGIPNPFKAVTKLISGIIGAVKGIVGAVISVITSPFGVNLDVPDYDIGVDQTGSIQGVLVTKDSAVASIPVLYGKRMLGAIRVFVEAGTGDNNKYLYVAYVFCEGPVKGVDKIMLDDNDAGIVAGDLTHGDEVAVTTGKYANRLSLQFFNGKNNKNGTGSQIASSLLQDIDTAKWTANHKLEGLCYIAARFEWIEGTTNDEIKANPYLGNVPGMIAEIEGRKIYDATGLGSTHTTAYEDETLTTDSDKMANPVSCLLDYLRNPTFGKGLSNDNFNWATWNTAADLCNQTVSYDNYENTKAFTTNHVVDTSISLMTNTKILLASFRGIMPYQGGKYSLKIEHGGDDTDITATPADPTTVMTVTNDHIIGGLSLDGESKQQKCNRLITTWVNPDEDYQPDEVAFPLPGSALDTTYLAEDNGVRLEKRITLPFCTSLAIAEQQAVVYLRKSRTQKLIQFTTNLASSNVVVGDLIRVINEHLSLDGKFRVMDIKISTAGFIDIRAIEHQAGHYGIGATGIEYIKPILNLPDPTSVQPITGLTATNV
mgnify:CR=1 FL=1|tara:strand:+ start:12874 stop:14595 length:1722 start_codon:yes stop_codon:yes gene_type:complete